MSHVADCDVQVKDLAALKEAAEFLGLQLMEGQQTYAWYGRWLNDWNSERAAAMKGRDPSQFGKCVHALRAKDYKHGDYEIGVVDNGDGTLGLVYDSYGSGKKLESACGQDLVKLKAEYGAVTAAKQLKKQYGHQGWVVRTVRDAHGRPVVKAVKQQ
jgi:hypothetical protein